MDLRPEDDPRYPHQVRALAALLAEGQTMTINLTARMTQQRLLIVDALAGTLGPPAMGLGPGDEGDYFIVGRFEHGLYVFRKGRGMNAAGYVANKLGIEPADAEVLEHLLDDLADPDHAITA